MLLFPILGPAQSERPENLLFDCIRGSFPDSGRALDSLMVVFESELVSEGLLESSEALDYRGLLQRIASGQGLVRPVERYFGPRFRTLPRDTTAYGNCQSYFGVEALTPQDSTLLRFAEFRESLLHESLTPSMEAAAYLDILTENDLRLPYYRYTTYDLIDRVAYETEFAPAPFASLETLGNLNTSGANVFQVYMTEEDQLIVADQLVTPGQMAELVSRHARTFEQSALYIVQVEADVKYGSFITLKDQIALAITKVRDQYARTLLGKTLTELTPGERQVVFGKYPVRIVTPQ